MKTVETYKEAVVNEMQHILSWSESQREQYKKELEQAIRVAKVNYIEGEKFLEMSR